MIELVCILALYLVGCALIVAGVFAILGLGAGLVASGIFCFGAAVMLARGVARVPPR